MSKVFTLFLFFFFIGCNKEEMAKNAVLDAMTSGYWKVVSFKKGTVEVTADFSSYKFRFKENLTVDAINQTTIEMTGSWNADPNAKTITSSFINASNPIGLLNGTWQITKSDWTFVEASQTVNGELRFLRLEKI